ncbi:MAG: class I tRNA ligase family protein, partial [Verrucomicrobiota bacterium]
LGNAYEKVLTDVVARFRRLMGDEVRFLTGLDEHGQKVQQAAEKLGVSPQAICDELAPQFISLCKRLGISNDDFIRTTEDRHKKVVTQLLQQLYDAGEIYQADYNGYYSVRQEQFVLLKEQVDGVWPEQYGEVVEIKESNYFFRLSKYQDWLVQFLQENPDFIFPRYRQKQVMEFLKEPINDLCISRPVERLSWGIPLPFDDGFVTYVWFDALINYVTGAGFGADDFAKYWPCDYHVIGKDIMQPAHAVYWPIMLKACGIELPRHLLVHGFWMLSGGMKMSKSTGNVVNPLDFVDKYGADAFRYFVTREMNVGQDSEFSPELFMSRYNGDLANDLGNLVARLLNMGGRYAGGTLPAATLDEAPEQTLRQQWQEVRAELLRLYEGFQFHSGLDRTLTFVKGINRYAEQRAPWKLAKSDDPADQEALKTSLATMAEGLRLAAAALTPVMPEISARIAGLLGEPATESWIDGVLDWQPDRLTGHTLGERTILFPKND